MKSDNVWRNFAFRLLIFSSSISLLGDIFRNTALNFWVYSSTAGSASSRLAAILLETAPAILFGFLSGVMADRFDRVKVLLASDIFRCGLSAIFAICAFHNLIRPTFILIFLGGVAEIFFTSSSVALLPQVVKRDQLTMANGNFQIASWIIRSIAPALAALAFVSWGPAYAFLFDSLSFLLSALFLQGLSKKFPQNRHITSSVDTSTVREYLSDLRAGMMYLVQHRSACAFLLATYGLSISVTTNAFSLLYLINRDFHYSLKVVGMFFSYNAIIAIIASLVTAKFITSGLRTTFYVTLVAMLFSQFMMGCAPNIWFLLSGIAISALANAPYNIVAVSLFQSVIHQDYMGRVEGIDLAIEGILSIVVSCVAAGVVAVYGARVAIVGAGIVGIILLLISQCFFGLWKNLNLNLSEVDQVM